MEIIEYVPVDTLIIGISMVMMTMQQSGANIAGVMILPKNKKE